MPPTFAVDLLAIGAEAGRSIRRQNGREADHLGVTRSPGFTDSLVAGGIVPDDRRTRTTRREACGRIVIQAANDRVATVQVVT